MGIQPDDSAGQDLVAGLLGAHRTGVRKVRNPAASKPECFGRVRRLAGNLYRDAGIVLVTDETSRTIQLVGIVAAQSRAANANFLRLGQDTVTAV
jgi:hypothetical protein